MNKTKLIEEISLKTDLTKIDVEKSINAFIEIITNAVKQGVKVTITGLGTLEKVKRSERIGINPKTKQKIQIKAKNAPKFKASKSFKDLVA